MLDEPKPNLTVKEKKILFLWWWLISPGIVRIILLWISSCWIILLWNDDTAFSLTLTKFQMRFLLRAAIRLPCYCGLVHVDQINLIVHCICCVCAEIHHRRLLSRERIRGLLQSQRSSSVLSLTSYLCDRVMTKRCDEKPIRCRGMSALLPRTSGPGHHSHRHRLSAASHDG